jgi:hypothetical protein
VPAPKTSGSALASASSVLLALLAACMLLA